MTESKNTPEEGATPGTGAAGEAPAGAGSPTPAIPEGTGSAVGTPTSLDAAPVTSGHAESAGAAPLAPEASPDAGTPSAPVDPDATLISPPSSTPPADPDATLEAPPVAASDAAATGAVPPTDAPSADASAAGAPVTDAPPTDAPVTDAAVPAADPPATSDSATDAPATDAPATGAPATDAAAPITDAAAPVDGAPATDALPTGAPAAGGTPAAETPGGALVSDRISLVSASGQTLSVGVRTMLGKHIVRQFGEESNVWDTEQCALERTPEGAWQIVPRDGTTNETLVNGEAVTAARALHDGDVIAVGRVAKGIVKLPLTVRRG